MISTRDYAHESNSTVNIAAPVAASSTASSSNNRSSATYRGALASLGPSTIAPSATSVRDARLKAASYSSKRSSTADDHNQSNLVDGRVVVDPFTRHRRLAEEYQRIHSHAVATKLTQSSASSTTTLVPPPRNSKSDADLIAESYRFVRTSADDADAAAQGSSSQRLAVAYYNRLFKEYAIADMTDYRTGRIGLRWRTQTEVLAGRGHFTCGNKHCDHTHTIDSDISAQLKSFEVNFSYVEGGVQKQTLVKLRLCGDCAIKLNYQKLKEIERHEKEMKRVKKEERRQRKEKKRKRKEEKSASKKKKKSSKRKRDDDDDDSSDSSNSEMNNSSSFDSDSSAPATSTEESNRKKSRREAPSAVSSSHQAASTESATTQSDSALDEQALFNQLFP